MAANKHPDRSAVVAAYQAGLSLIECGDKFGLSGTSVRRIMKADAPATLRKMGAYKGKSKSRSVAVLDLSGSLLEEFFCYDPADGLFRHKTWRGPRSGGPGTIAGTIKRNGYMTVGLPNGDSVLAHRLAWLWMTGAWPKCEIDHVNGNRSDNRFENLREATRTQNAQNGGIRRTNKTGRIGVFFDEKRNKYVATLMFSGQDTLRKRFDTFDEAVAARSKAEEKFFGEYAPGHHEGVADPPSASDGRP